jgi:hypothetical protein
MLVSGRCQVVDSHSSVISAHEADCYYVRFGQSRLREDQIRRMVRGAAQCPVRATDIQLTLKFTELI